MPTFTFSDHDIGNSLIVADDNRLQSFVISSERGVFINMRKNTTIRFFDHGMALAAVDWRNKVMEISGVRKPLRGVYRKVGRALSPTREWKWSDKTYVIAYNNHIWTAKCDENTVAAYTPLKRHLFKKDELATLNLLTEVPDGETALVILGLLFRDLMSPPKKRISYKEEMAKQGPKLAANLVANVIVGALCTIQ